MEHTCSVSSWRRHCAPRLTNCWLIRSSKCLWACDMLRIYKGDPQSKINSMSAEVLSSQQLEEHVFSALHTCGTGSAEAVKPPSTLSYPQSSSSRARTLWGPWVLSSWKPALGPNKRIRKHSSVHTHKHTWVHTQMGGTILFWYLMVPSSENSKIKAVHFCCLLLPEAKFPLFHPLL